MVNKDFMLKFIKKEIERDINLFGCFLLDYNLNLIEFKIKDVILDRNDIIIRFEFSDNKILNDVYYLCYNGFPIANIFIDDKYCFKHIIFKFFSEK